MKTKSVKKILKSLKHVMLCYNMTIASSVSKKIIQPCKY